MSKFVRYIEEKLFKEIKKDSGFKYLADKVGKSCGELDLQLRKNYFDLYFRGIKLADIKYKLENNIILYTVTIDKNFVEKQSATDGYTLGDFFNEEENKTLFDWNTVSDGKEMSGIDYVIEDINGELLKLLFDTHIKTLKKNIEIRSYSEEIEVQQLIISDNLNRRDLIIIDRHAGKSNARIDILALKQIKDDRYGFLVIEVKSGNSPDLGGKIVEELKKYTGEIREHIDEYKKSYEINYEQKKKLGLLGDKLPEKIIIENEVDSLLIVSGYSEMAGNSLRRLKENLKGKSVNVQWIKNKIEINSNSLDELTEDEDDIKENHKIEDFLKNVSGNYVGIYKKWIDNWASASDKFKINMGRRGFSLNVKSSKNKILKIIKPLPEAIDLITEKDREELGISKEQYEKYLDEIRTIPSALNVINKKQKECSYNNISPEELDKILKATSELAENIYILSNKSE